jgi:hypothetical protein
MTAMDKGRMMVKDKSLSYRIQQQEEWEDDQGREIMHDYIRRRR